MMSKRENMNPIIMHTNYCGNTPAVEYMFKKAKSWGYDGIECHVESSSNNYNSHDEYITDVKKYREKYNIEHIYFGYSLKEAGDSDGAVRDMAVSKAADFFTLAKKELDVDLCNIAAGGYILSKDADVHPFDFDRHGSAAASEDDIARYVDSLQKLAAHLERIGVKVALETHMNLIHDTPEATVKLVDMIGSPNVGVNMDYGNYYWHERCKSLEETFRIYEGRIFYFHLKNAIKLPNFIRFQTQLSEGQINHREYLSLIKKYDIQAPIVLESPRDGDREWYAQEDLAYIKSVMTDLDF